LIWKVIAALLELFADTTTYRLFHGKYQRATREEIIGAPRWCDLSWRGAASYQGNGGF
jgi:hypothetical protein